MDRGLSDEARAALEANVNATIGTLNPDGSVHLAHVSFLYEDGRLYFETASSTRKARNAAERPRVSFLVDHPEIDVRAEGRARVLIGPEAQAVNQRLREKYGFGAKADRYFRSIDDCAVEISVDRWRTWKNVRLRQEIRETQT